jgi:uncharacterized protein YdaU (DUF1376 family)
MAYDVRQRLMHLTSLVEQLGEPLWFWRVDLKCFYGDVKVTRLGEYAHAWLFMLGRMAQQGGYLPDDDDEVATLMLVSKKVWRQRYKPKLEPMYVRTVSSPFGSILTHKRLLEFLIEAVETRLAGKTRTAKATAARWSDKKAKSKQRPSVTENVTEASKSSVTESVTDTVTDVLTDIPVHSTEGNKALPSQAESFITDAPTSDDGSLRPATNGAVEGSALTGERSLEGRSPPEPSGMVENPEPPHDPELVRRLVEAGIKRSAKPLSGLMSIMPKEDDDDAGT